MNIDFILFLLTFLIGYYLGTKRNPKSDLSTINQWTQKEMNDMYGKLLPKEELKVGPIHRPTHQQIKDSQIPDEKKAELKAMEDTLRDIPELNV